MAYIGKAPGFGIRNRFYYTAAGGQTLFSGADSNGQVLKYGDGKYIDVYLNGVSLVDSTDYTATTGTSISLTTGATASDIVEIIAYELFSVANLANYSNTMVVPFYKADSTLDTISLTATQLVPFFKSDGSADNIPLTA
jgi:hypothetical protein